VQLLFFLGIPAECHTGETKDGRCGVSTSRHPPPPGTSCPGCQICRTRIIITNLHRAEAMARKRNCSAAQIALITGSLFIQLFTALAATVPAGAKLVMQITAGDLLSRERPIPHTLFGRCTRRPPATLRSLCFNAAPFARCRRRLAPRPPPRQLLAVLGVAARLRRVDPSLPREVCWPPPLRTARLTESPLHYYH
jgi:hypothetical protein